jgi:uncharacterized coiled-coil DUF342 family protein
MSGEKHKKTFKYYYDNDEEFKKQHLKKLSEKVECECGFIGAKCNMSRHKRSHLHLEKIGKTDEIKKLEKQKIKINNQIKKLKHERSKIIKQLEKINKKE